MPPERRRQMTAVLLTPAQCCDHAAGLRVLGDHYSALKTWREFPTVPAHGDAVRPRSHAWHATAGFRAPTDAGPAQRATVHVSSAESLRRLPTRFDLLSQTYATRDPQSQPVTVAPWPQKSQSVPLPQSTRQSTPATGCRDYDSGHVHHWRSHSAE